MLKLRPDGSTGEIDQVGNVPVTTGVITGVAVSSVRILVDGE